MVARFQDVRRGRVPAVDQGQGPGIDIQRLLQGLPHFATDLPAMAASRLCTP